MNVFFFLQKNTTNPTSTDPTTEDKKLIAKRQAEQTLNSLINATIKQKPPSSPIEFSRTSSYNNFSINCESMHSRMEDVKNKDCDEATTSVQQTINRRKEESTSKAEIIFPLETKDNIPSSVTSHSSDTRTSQEFASTLPNAVMEESTVNMTTSITEKNSENECLDAPG